MENGLVTRTSEQQAAAGPMLAWLKIHALPERSVEPCELRFSAGFNVLLGLNATGKTTLLELITAALSFNFTKFKEEPFDVEYMLQFPGGIIHARVHNTQPPQHPLPTVRGRQGGAPLDYAAELRVSMESPPSGWDVKANLSALQVRSHDGRSMSAPFPSATVFRSDFLLRALQLMAGTGPDPLLTFVVAVLSWSVLRRFDESLGFLEAITGDAAWIELVRAHENPSEVELTDLGLVPGTLCDEVVLQCVQRSFSDEAESVSVSHQKLGVLARAPELLGFRAMRVELRLQQRKTLVGQDRLKLGDLRFVLERHDGSIITHTELSYGQKRLLALLYYLEMHPHTLVADELVDGLHHRWIDDSIEAVNGRQAFLASQNPLLLDHLEFASAGQVASTFITCRAERIGDRKRIIWSNMSDYDAERFFRAYQVDVQHVSEILLSKGLW